MGSAVGCAVAAAIRESIRSAMSMIVAARLSGRKARKKPRQAQSPDSVWGSARPFALFSRGCCGPPFPVRRDATFNALAALRVGFVPALALAARNAYLPHVQ